MSFWKDYQSHIGEQCEIRTERTHYRGIVTDFNFFGETYAIRITETIRGKLQPGDVIRAAPDKLSSESSH